MCYVRVLSKKCVYNVNVSKRRVCGTYVLYECLYGVYKVRNVCRVVWCVYEACDMCVECGVVCINIFLNKDEIEGSFFVDQMKFLESKKVCRVYKHPP